MSFKSHCAISLRFSGNNRIVNLMYSSRRSRIFLLPIFTIFKSLACFDTIVLYCFAVPEDRYNANGRAIWKSSPKIAAESVGWVVETQEMPPGRDRLPENPANTTPDCCCWAIKQIK